MKKIIISVFTLSLILSANQAFAKFDLNKVVNTVGEVAAASGSSNSGKSGGKKSSNPITDIQDEILGKVDKITGKVEKKIDDVTSKFDEKVGKFEKKIDNFENKIEKVEKITDDVLGMVSKINSSEIAKYVAIAKKIAIALAVAFALFILLLILVFVQLIRVSFQLKKLKQQSSK